jgi:HEAT repeat protein
MIRRARQAGYPARLYSKSDKGFIRLYDLALAWQDRESGYRCLVDGLHARDSVYRYWAVLGLGFLNDAPPEAVQLLEERLADEEGAVVRSAVWSLHRLGRTSVRSLEVLRKVLRRGNYAERLEAIQIVRRIGPDASSLKPELEHLANLKTRNYYEGYLPSAAGFALEAIERE